MIIHDISMPIREDMQVYKNREEKKPHIKVLRDHSEGSVYESRLSIEMHTGTHMDAPLHMIEGGEDITIYPVEDYVSKAKVIDLCHIEAGISKADLVDKGIAKGDFVLLKTKNSLDEEFNPDFIYLNESGANYLASLEVVGVGIDSLGIERAQPGHETHKALLSRRIMILEGLRLKDIDEGDYTLIAAPLNIPGLEATPVRALLLEGNF